MQAGLAKAGHHLSAALALTKASAFWMSLGVGRRRALVECRDLSDPERSDLDHSRRTTSCSGRLASTPPSSLAIIGIIGFQVVKLLKARKRQAGAGLHFRIAGVFSLVALFPAVLLAIFATVSIDRTFDTFFSTRVKSIVSNSVEVAQSYMQESGQTIRSDIVGVSREVEEKATLYQEDKAAFDRFFSAAVALRAVPAAFIIDSKGNLLAAASEGPPYRAPPLADIARASEGRIVPVSWDLSNGVAALKKLVGLDDAYLYALRPVNPNVFRLLQRTQFNIMQFAQLEQSRGQYQLVFAIMYVLLALTLAHIGDLDRACLREPPRHAHPKADRRRPGSEPGQFERSV